MKNDVVPITVELRVLSHPRCFLCHGLAPTVLASAEMYLPASTLDGVCLLLRM